MEICMIGLGKMGLNLAENMLNKKFDVSGFDRETQPREALTQLGGKAVPTVEELLRGQHRKIVWLMLPAGASTNDMVVTVLDSLQEHDILIDAGNSHYQESQQNAAAAAAKGVHFFDVGTSGGMAGAQQGACMMIGGDAAIFANIEPLFAAICVTDGYLYCGPVGSGHYLKMIHNGIEYGMMQAIGEGFNILHHSEFEYDLEQVAAVFNHGSVIRSWLMELTVRLLQNDPTLQDLTGVIPSSGEGKWTVEEILRLELSSPVITQALFTRYASSDKEKYGEKVVAALRNQFGGHHIPTKGAS